MACDCATVVARYCAGMTPPKGRMTRNPLFDTVEPIRPTPVPDPLELPADPPPRRPEYNAIDKDGPYYVQPGPPLARPPYGSPEAKAYDALPQAERDAIDRLENPARWQRIGELTTKPAVKATQVYLNPDHLAYLTDYRMAAMSRGVKNPSNSEVIRFALDQLTGKVSAPHLADLKANGLL